MPLQRPHSQVGPGTHATNSYTHERVVNLLAKHPVAHGSYYPLVSSARRFDVPPHTVTLRCSKGVTLNSVSMATRSENFIATHLAQGAQQAFSSKRCDDSLRTVWRPLLVHVRKLSRAQVLHVLPRGLHRCTRLVPRA